MKRAGSSGLLREAAAAGVQAIACAARVALFNVLSLGRCKSGCMQRWAALGRTSGHGSVHVAAPPAHAFTCSLLRPAPHTPQRMLRAALLALLAAASALPRRAAAAGSKGEEIPTPAPQLARALLAPASEALLGTKSGGGGLAGADTGGGDVALTPVAVGGSEYDLTGTLFNGNAAAFTQAVLASGELRAVCHGVAAAYARRRLLTGGGPQPSSRHQLCGHRCGRHASAARPGSARPGGGAGGARARRQRRGQGGHRGECCWLSAKVHAAPRPSSPVRPRRAGRWRCARAPS